jgi:hypothetical protein
MGQNYTAPTRGGVAAPDGDGRCDGGRSGDGNRYHAAKQGMTQTGIDGNLMLRPWVHDLTPENPTAKIAKTYSIKDFESRSNRFVMG